MIIPAPGQLPGRAVCILASALLAAFVAFMIWLSWTGYIQSDDAIYMSGAEAWADHGPVLLRTHAQLRHMIVLPLAFMFRVLAVSEPALNVVTLVYTLALFALLAHVAFRAAGFWAAVFTVMLLASVPILVGSASLLFSDVPEALFILGSIVCFHRAWSGPRAPWLFAAGLLSGLAAITRETTLCLVLFYAGLFLLGYGRNRWAYLWIGLGSLVVVGGETLLLWAASGDPLYRLHATMLGVQGDNPNVPGRMDASAGLNGEGLFPVPRWIGAPLMMAANQMIGPITWCAVPAAALLLHAARTRPQGANPQSTALELPRLLVVFAIIWFVMLSWVLQSLFLQPRYQTVTLAILALPPAIILAAALGTRWQWPGLAALAATILGGMLLIAMSDRNVMQSERQVIELAKDRPGEIETDPITYFRGKWLMQRAGVDKRIAPQPPQPGDLYIYNTRPRSPLPATWPVQTVPPGWTELQRLAEPRRPLVRWIDALGLLRLLPPILVRKIDPPPRTSILYQVPPA